MISENKTHLIFKAKTFGFSVFAIVDPKPTPTSITLTVEPEEVTVGEEVTLRGRISPPASLPISLYTVRPDGTVDMKTLTSSPDGSFLLALKLNMEGEWRFTAEFAGNSSYERSASSWVKAVAKPRMPVENIISLIVIAAATITAMLIIKRIK